MNFVKQELRFNLVPEVFLKAGSQTSLFASENIT